MRFTVLGSAGFIGSHLVEHLTREQIDVYAPGRYEHISTREDLGHVIYAIGLTADFRQRPFETIEGHVCKLIQVLQQDRFESFLYLSSTRLYGIESPTSEEAPVQVRPCELNHLYNISKLMGESACFATNNPRVRIARISNVFGPDYLSMNFLSTVIRDALEKKRVLLETSLDSEKDYIKIEDVVSLLPKISLSGKSRLYNVARGSNISNRDLLQRLSEITGCLLEVAPGAGKVYYPPISINSVTDEFDFSPHPVLDALPALVSQYREAYAKR